MESDDGSPTVLGCLPADANPHNLLPTHQAIRTQQLCHRDRCYAWGVALAHV